MVDLGGTLGPLDGAAIGRFGTGDRAHQLVRVAADHALPVVHDGPHEPVRLGDEPVLEEHGHVVPVHQPVADLVPAERAHELPVPHAVGDGEHEATAAPQLAPQPRAQQELDARQVDLAQVPRVVHVRQVHVQVGGQAHGRVDAHVEHAERLPPAPGGRHVGEQRATEVRQVDRGHGQHDDRERGARRGQRDHRGRRAAVAVRVVPVRGIRRRRRRRRLRRRRQRDQHVENSRFRTGAEIRTG